MQSPNPSTQNFSVTPPLHQPTMQVKVLYCSQQTSIVIKTSCNDLSDLIQTGHDIILHLNHTQNSKHPDQTNPLLQRITPKIKALSAQLAKMNTIMNSLARFPRNLFTPLLSTLTGLASDKTVTQLKSIISNIDFRSQRNHLQTDSIILNQQKLASSLNQTITLVNDMQNSVRSQQKYLRKILIHYRNSPLPPQIKKEVTQVIFRSLFVSSL